MSRKIPLILLPGLLCDRALWDNQIKSLESLADCQIGDTTRHDNITTIARSILASAPPQFALAGLSMGGYVALEIVRQAPQRVLKLCLLNTSAREDAPEQRQRRMLLLAMSKAGQFKGVTPRLLPMLIHPDRLQDHELTSCIMNMAERLGRAVFTNQQTAILNRIDSRPYLKNISCPVQVIGGSDDALIPLEVIRELSELIPHAHLNIIESCGHLSTLEQPEQVTGLMDRWIRRQN